MHWSHLTSDFTYENTCFEPYQAISFIVVCCMQQEASEECCTIGSTVTSIQPGCRTPISSSTAGVSSSCPIRGIRKETFQVQANLQTRPLRALSSTYFMQRSLTPLPPLSGGESFSPQTAAVCISLPDQISGSQGAFNRGPVFVPSLWEGIFLNL